MKIAIITDGNNVLGMGHIYQSMTLAYFLLNESKRPLEVFFLTKSDAQIVELLKQTNCKVCRYEDDDAIFKALQESKPERVIFDKLDVSPDLASKIKSRLKLKLIICTNLTEANNFADVTVLADIGSNFQNIHRKNSETGQINFFGPKYWLLRPEFYMYKKSNKVLSPAVRNITLIFGGADPCNYSTSVLNELLQMDTPYDIKVILGAAFVHREDLLRLNNSKRQSGTKVTFLENIKNVAEVMYNSDLVFASPGLSFFEALAVGTPVVGFHQNELQKQVYNNYLVTYGREDLQRIPDLMTTRSFLFASDPRIRVMEIGDGKDEIIAEIVN